MADIAHRLPGARPTPAWRNGAIALGGVVAFGIALNLSGPGRVAGLQSFMLVFNSLLLEAMPFILLGAVVSGLIEVFVPSGAFDRLTRLPRSLQLPAAGVAGFAFPVCDCGSIPVARRLATKGLAPAAAVTFMLAAPILNPIVIASTFVAYRGREFLWPMVFGRIGLGLTTAIVIGWVVGNKTKEQLLQAERPGEHGHEEDSGSRAAALFGHITDDFLFMGRYLVLGAGVAAALQTFVPQSVLGSIANTPVVSLVAMMALAAILSICSESDAFVAASFVQFGLAGQLAFLAFGPMVDTKLGFIYAGTFSASFFRTVAIVVGAMTLVGTLWMEVAFG
jgi:uncharacterized membrane protein YraQ (UPF0718 family)